MEALSFLSFGILYKNNMCIYISGKKIIIILLPIFTEKKIMIIL